MTAAAPDDPRRVLRALAPSVYIPSLLEFSADAAILPVVPLIALDLGFSVPQAAALTTILGVAAFLGPIPASGFIQRIGARRALVVTGAALVLTGAAAALVLGGAAQGSEAAGAGGRALLVGVLVVMAISSQVWQLGRQAYLGSALPSGMRARGMTLFGGTVRIGQVIGPLLGAVVIALGHETWVFALQAALCAVATAMVAVFLPPGERTGPAARRIAARTAPSTARTRLTRAVLARMTAVALGILPVMMSRTVRPVIVPLLGQSLGLDAFWVSLVFGAGAVVEIALVVPAGTLMDRHGRAAVAVPCSLVMGIGFGLLALLAVTLGREGPAGAILALLVPSLLISLGNGLGSGIVQTLGLDVSPVRERTRYLGWWNTMIGAGRFAAPLMVAAITAIAPVTVAALAAGGACLVGAGWLGRVLPRLRPAGGA